MTYNESVELFSKYDLELTEKQYEMLSSFEKMLIEKNKVMNLTAITDSKEIWIKHFLDSILITKKIDMTNNSKIIDVGCGAGFPSIPMAIYRSDLKITLLDSLQKRVNFLNDVIKELGLVNCDAIHSRAEEAGKNKDLREKYDFACARAVANMNTLSEYCIPFVRENGLFIAMKGPNGDINDAIDAIVTLGGDFEDKIEYSVEENERVIYTIYKVSPTPSKYPRNAKQIKSKPL